MSLDFDCGRVWRMKPERTVPLNRQGNWFPMKQRAIRTKLWFLRVEEWRYAGEMSSFARLVEQIIVVVFIVAFYSGTTTLSKCTIDCLDCLGGLAML